MSQSVEKMSRITMLKHPQADDFLDVISSFFSTDTSRVKVYLHLYLYLYLTNVTSLVEIES